MNWQLIKGKHAVMEAMRANIGIDRIIVDFKSQYDPDIHQIQKLAERNRIKVQRVSTASFQTYCDEKQSQGILAYVASKQSLSLDHILDHQDDYPFLVAVDHILDPYNFGAILRTCETLGVNAVLYPKDRNCQITPGVIKASSGAIHYLDMVKITNLAYTLDALQEAGYWVYGADSNNGVDLNQLEPQFPLVLVVGNEEKGISPGILKKLDGRIHIPLVGQIESMNVSVATGIILYNLQRAKK